MTNSPGPIRFKTRFKDRIWGGRKLETLLKKAVGSVERPGESWEISSVPGDVSEVAEGPLAGKTLQEILGSHGSAILGERLAVKHGNVFPLLIKFIDAMDDLSIQVHPDDALAMKRHNSLGKTEMWYVFAAEPGAKLVSGFKGGVTRGDYERALKAGNLDNVLESHPVEPGDVFFLPAGRVHAIGKGICLAEIQQTSDVTYRLWDYNRVDKKTGKTRELHTAEGLGAIDFSHVKDARIRTKPVAGQSIPVVTCPYFKTSVLLAESPVSREPSEDSFRIYINVGGNCRLESPEGNADLAFGQTLLIPAATGTVKVLPVGGPATLLEVTA